MNLPVIPQEEACTLCGFCAQVCPPHALRWTQNADDTRLLLLPADCDGCGKCVTVCNFHAIVLAPAEGNSAEESRTLRRSPLVACKNCGAPIASQAELAYIAQQVGAAEWQNLCLDCRGLF